VTKQAELVEYVFDGQPHPLSGVLLGWMESSARFTAFLETYQDKIRKKIRLARDPESGLDLQCELEVAYCLLQDRRLDLVYERYASAKRRGPDFTVTYRTNLAFNIEVTRLRVEGDEGGDTLGDVSGTNRATNLSRQEERIQRILLAKLGQMQPSIANLLVIHTSNQLAQSIDLSRLIQELKIRVEVNELPVYAANLYTNPAAFYRDFLHLSAILLKAANPQVWVNKQARPGLDEKVLSLVSSLL
jgi:hypothetical protein